MRNLIFSIVALLCFACTNNRHVFDASGVFEAEEVVVSSEISGKILRLDVNEGDTISQGKAVAEIDALSIELQKEQVEASIGALRQKTSDITPQVQVLNQQINVQRSQLAHLKKEKARFENLVKADAATPKQLDDLNAQIDVLEQQTLVTERQVSLQRSNVLTQNRSTLSEKAPMQKRIAQLQDQIKRARVINPLNGTVLVKYAEGGEITSAGKPLYKIADLSLIILRAYVSGSQLSVLKLGQQVNVLIDSGAEKYKAYKGTITWISDKAEFTPKTIQTKEERVNLVYAIKVRVPNDGYLKIGMYGEMDLK